MATDPGTVDAGELRRLLRELSGDLRSRRRFVETYVEMWPSRLERMGAAIADGDDDETRVVLLSIRSSSVMLGVIGVAALASTGIRALDEHDRSRVVEVRDALEDIGQRSCERLLELEAAEARQGR